MSNTTPLTDEQFLLLSQFSYVRLPSDKELQKLKDNTLKTLIEDAILPNAEYCIINNNGCLSTGDVKAILNRIKDDKVLANLTLKKCEDQNGQDKGGMKAFVFERELKDESGKALLDDKGEVVKDTYFAFTGSEGAAAANSKAIDFFAEDWFNNYIIGLKNRSRQFTPSKEFVEKYMSKNGRTYLTGHSQGAANAMYACATVPGCTGKVFDGFGISQMLSKEENERLKSSGLINYVNEKDHIGSLFFHSEETRYVKFQEAKTIGVDGSVIDVEHICEGHYTQAMTFDINGNAYIVEKSKLNKEIEELSQNFHVYNKIFGTSAKEGLSAYLSVNEGIKDYKEFAEDFKKDFSHAMKGLDAAKDKADHTLTTGIATITESIKNLGNDQEAIKKEIDKGLMAIQRNADSIISSLSKEFSDELSQISKGYNQWLKGNSIVGGVEYIHDRISKGEGVAEAVFFSKIDQLKSTVDGMRNMCGGLDGLRQESIKAFNKSVDYIIKEIGEKVDTQKIISSAGPALVDGVEKAKQHLTGAFNRFRNEVAPKINRYFKNAVGGTLKIIDGAAHAALINVKLKSDCSALARYIFGQAIQELTEHVQNKLKGNTSQNTSNNLAHGSGGKSGRILLNPMEIMKIANTIWKKRGEADSLLTSLGKDVEGARKFFEGHSSDAFVEDFNRVQGQMREQLYQCLENISKTMEEAAIMLAESDKSEATRLTLAKGTVPNSPISNHVSPGSYTSTKAGSGNNAALEMLGQVSGGNNNPNKVGVGSGVAAFIGPTGAGNILSPEEMRRKVFGSTNE